MVQAKTQYQPSEPGKRNVIARNVNAAEPVALLEIAETAPLLLTGGGVCTPEVATSSLGAGSDSSCDQGVCGSPVAMLNHREYAHEASLTTILVAHQLRKADEITFKKTPVKTLRSGNVLLTLRTGSTSSEYCRNRLP